MKEPTELIKPEPRFRLVDRLLAEIERVLKVNEAPDVTLEIVEAARQTLVIWSGVTGLRDDRMR